MSLTDEFEISEMFRKPVRVIYHPNFHGDLPFCDYKTGHCTNTDACQDCKVHQSMQDVREYTRLLEDK